MLSSMVKEPVITLKIGELDGQLPCCSTCKYISEPLNKCTLQGNSSAGATSYCLRVGRAKVKAGERSFSHSPYFITAKRKPLYATKYVVMIVFEPEKSLQNIQIE